MKKTPIKIPIKHLIDSGAWFNCTSRGGNMSYFRIRIISFNKKQQIHDSTFGSGIPWLLNLEIINLRTSPQSDWAIADCFSIADQNDYIFSNVSYQFSNDTLNPLIKYTAVIVFSLPDNDENEYYLMFQDICFTGGRIQEI